MDKRQREILTNTFLFRGLDDSELTTALSLLDCELRTFNKGACIYSPQSYEKKIGIVLSGVCEVRRLHSDGGFVPLNRIGTAGSFGIVAVFSEKTFYPTHVFAMSDCTVMLLSKEEIFLLMQKHPTVTYNILGFMAERIGFLNDKISTFSGNNVEQKLASYLLQNSKECGSSEFAFNKKRSAEAINAGRASLYRAIEKLQKLGLITLDDKRIIIKDLMGLERIAK